MVNPDLTLLSLGAGVQSTTLALMVADGTLPRVDGAIFADTGWEPRGVYRHLDRLAVVLAEAKIPLYRVSKGNLRRDAIDPSHRYASIPYFVRNPPFMVKEPIEWTDCNHSKGVLNLETTKIGSADACALCMDNPGRMPVAWRERPATPKEREGMGRRQCTSEYKLVPINRKVRELLGAKAPGFRRVPKGKVAEQWIGFSTDEITRVSDNRGVSYITKKYPLLDLGMSRGDCRRWLTARGWGSTTKSACIGCPYHGNAQWRDLRDNHPDEWDDAVEFDQAIRKGGARGLPLNGEAFLHRSRVPLSIAPIDRVTRGDVKQFWEGQATLFDLAEDGDPDGCSPYGCRSGEPA